MEILRQFGYEELKDVFGITFEQGHNNFEINEALPPALHIGFTDTQGEENQ